MIKIIVVGKLNQKYLKTGIDYYEKQLTQKVQWIEVQDEPTEQGKELEADRILKHIGSNEFVFALAIEGEMMDSIAFAKKIENVMTYDQKQMVFIIGGSYGLSNRIINRANTLVSFSKMTFPHQLMRLILIEQIYRAMMIHKNHPYHK
jgi:23S rRNA (pseudouridine1915-N3)-methyltransferase